MYSVREVYIKIPGENSWENQLFKLVKKELSHESLSETLITSP